MNRSTGLLATVAALLTFTAGCSDSTAPSGSLVTIQFQHQVSGLPLFFDSPNYLTRPGGQVFSVTKLKYFVSEIRLHQRDNGGVYVASRPHYIDASLSGNSAQLKLADVPSGTYNRISFVFGITDAENTTGALPSPDFDDMAWPANLGGGYHYMKLEGNIKETDNALTPFEAYLGRLNTKAYTFADTLAFTEQTFSDNDRWQINLNMNIEQWFNNPNTVVLPATTDSTYTATALRVLQENGDTVYSVSAPFIP